MSTSDLNKCILNTIHYFNLFNFPLTAREIGKNLWRPGTNIDFRRINSALNDLVKNKTLGMNEGFYFLKRKDNIVFERKQKYLLAQSKMNCARPYLRLISRLPFVRAIFICNNLAYQNAPEGSDIDLAIICENNRLWTTRFFAALAMKLLRQRPTEASQKNKICLSFYLTESNLRLEKIAYPNDIHFIYWLNQFLPIHADETLVEKFFAENAWTRRFLPNLNPVEAGERWRIKKQSRIKNFFEAILRPRRIGQPLEKFLKAFQLKILPRRLHELSQSNPKDVIISDTILKFHDNDARQKVKQKWLAATAQLGQSDYGDFRHP